MHESSKQLLETARRKEKRSMRDSEEILDRLRLSVEALCRRVSRIEYLQTREAKERHYIDWHKDNYYDAYRDGFNEALELVSGDDEEFISKIRVR